jgi:hypothetical protein
MARYTRRQTACALSGAASFPVGNLIDETAEAYAMLRAVFRIKVNSNRMEIDTFYLPHRNGLWEATLDKRSHKIKCI